VIAAACFSKITKVLAVALQFFAGRDPEKGSDTESDSDVIFFKFENFRENLFDILVN
jgi:hypothetical protein